MTEDKKPVAKKTEAPKRELTDRYKRMKMWYDTKVSTAVFLCVVASYAYLVHDGDMGLLAEWYIVLPIIAFMSFGPLASPEPEYKK